MLVTLEAIRQAAGRVSAIARRTPVLDLSDLAGRPLLVKCESHQPGGAFKIRGATNMLKRLPADALRRGVVTYSSGNHGQAVALAASRLDGRAVIVMPTTAPAVKVAGVRRWGAEVIQEGTTSIERRKRAEAEADARGLTMVPPFDHEWIIEGQGTCGLEILEQVPDAEPLSSCRSAAVAWCRASRPRSNCRARTCSVVGVEPAGAAKMSESLKAGHPITLPRTDTIADGLMPVRPGDLTFEHVKAFVDHVVTVDDERIARAALWLFHEAKQVIEPSGAATVAAVLWPADDGPLADRSKKIVAVLSGGNVAPETLAELGKYGVKSAGSTG